MVFLLDDDEMVRCSVSRLLNASNFIVRASGDPDDLYDQFEELSNCRSVILLDHRLSTANSTSVLRRLCQRGSRIPVVLFSGRLPELTDDLVAFGVRGIVSKPAGAETLISALEAALGEPTSDSG